MELAKPGPCPVCGKTMVDNWTTDVGDPAFVCATDDPAHRAAAAERKAERERILADAAKPRPDPTPEAIAAIAAWERHDAGDRKDAHE